MKAISRNVVVARGNIQQCNCLGNLTNAKIVYGLFQSQQEKGDGIIKMCSRKKRYCLRCNEELFNRPSHAIYCKKCADKISECKRRIYELNKIIENPKSELGEYFHIVLTKGFPTDILQEVVKFAENNKLYLKPLTDKERMGFYLKCYISELKQDKKH